ncbi:superoxide dismutase family protein [Metabacillus sp. GX 13764]|uniref:superoxide dismutase family protein n=1 Tax=Metabacillus kandeliae TaxID=2900151 RepID=UPI001E295244|nr:superoxide dismutase family protein [Metabacillus kandeliae]MCD7033520.1 superoxide dismutase family protein [Metabacillus kandeliae]
MKKVMILAGAGLLLFSAGCQQREHMNEQEVFPAEKHAVMDVTVPLINSEGKEAGKAVLSETFKGVNVHLTAKGLAPGAKAIHFHETGSCKTPDFMSAGGHFNPEGKMHGLKNPKGPHAGDMLNIIIPESGTADVNVTAPFVTLEEGKPNSLLDENGSALVIHEKADDYVTDPAGNAGKRILCGVVKKQ